MMVQSGESMNRVNFGVSARSGLVSLVVLAMAALLVISIPSTAFSQDNGGEEEAAADGADADADEGGPTYIGVGLGFYVENSRIEGETTRQVDTDDESFDYTADNVVMGSVSMMKTAGNRLRAGAGIHYYGSYETVRDPEEDEDPEDIEADELGQFLTLFARAEWLIPFADDLELVLGAEAGVISLFPDGEFRREIEAMKDDDIGVFGGPRPGISLAPMVGARWEIDDRLALRADFAVRWERLLLFNVSDTVENISYERNWTGKILRYNLGIGMEVTL